jgi:hypothetical protein
MELPALSSNSHVQHGKSKFPMDASCKKVRSVATESAALTEVLREVVPVIRNTLQHDGVVKRQRTLGDTGYANEPHAGGPLPDTLTYGRGY